MKKYKLYTFLFYFSSLCWVYGQDPHFSQFAEHSALINPALTGVDHSLKFNVGYKNQWQSVSTPYRTYGASVESRLLPGGWKRISKHRGMTFKQRNTGHFAAGLSVYKDKVGDGNSERTQGNLSLAVFIRTGKKSLLSCGLQGSLAQQKLNNAALVFPNQYNGLAYDPSMASGENFASQNFSYTDLGAGLLWSYNRTSKQAGASRIKVNIGVSAFHLNKPRQAYLLTSSNSFIPKYVLYGDILLRPLFSKLALAPSFMYQKQGPSRELLAGFMIKYFTGYGGSRYTGIDKSNCMSYGAFIRRGDAFILMMLFEWKEQYAVGLSYDINISKLSNASSGRGGMELMLRYTPPATYLYQKRKGGSPDLIDH